MDGQQLMRVYGALMWSLGKVLVAPEVPRVYIGSWYQNHLFSPIKFTSGGMASLEMPPSEHCSSLRSRICSRYHFVVFGKN